MTKQIKSIIPSGIVRNTTNRDSKDGSLLEAINMRYKDQSWRGVNDKSKGRYAVTAFEQKGLFYHPVLPANTYVAYKESDRTVNTILYTDGVESQVITTALTLPEGTVFDRFSCLGNTLIVWCATNKYTLYYDNITGSYKDLSFLPVPIVGVSEIETETKDITDKLITYPDPTPDYGLGDFNLSEYVRQNMVSDYLKTRTEMQEKNKIEGFVVVRLAYRLFDGSYVLHSLPYVYHVGYNALHKPVLSYTASPDPGSDPWSLTYNYYAKMAVLYNFFGTGTFTLPNFNLCGVVESLDVFCSRPISSYNYDTAIDKWTRDGTTFIPSYQTDQITKIMDEQLYKVHSIPIADIIKQADHYDGVTGKYMYAKAGVVYPDMTKDVVANQLLPIDTFSYHANLSQCDYQYNSRLHIGNLDVKLSSGYNNLFHAMFVRKYGVHNGYDQLGDILINSDNKTKFLGDYVETGGLAPTGFKLYQQVWLKSDDGIKVITSEVQKSYVTTFDAANIPTGYAYYYYYDTAVTKKALVFTPVISYPDYRAIKIRYYYTQDAQRFWLADYALKSLPGMNIAYYLPDLTTSDGSTGAYYPNVLPLPSDLHSGTAMPSDDVLTDNDIIHDTNRVQVSGITNPFFWDAKNSYRVGMTHNNVKAIITAQSTMSDGQFGQFPIYVNTDAGWFVMQHGNGEVLYASIQQINNEILLSRDSLAGISGSVVFAAKEGLRILSGNEVKELSIPVEGAIINPVGADSYFNAALTGLTVPNVVDFLSTVPFLTYLQGCKVMYDVENKEIIVTNASYKYSYVFSLYNESWAKITESFERSLVIGGRMIGVKHSEDTNHTYTLCYLDSEAANDDSECKYLMMQTRPLNLASLLSKRIDKIVLRADYTVPEGENAVLLLYGSNDAANFQVLNYSKRTSGNDFKINRIPGNFKYYILVFACAKDQATLQQIDVLYEDRFAKLL